jgi:hypothetical protein
MSAEFIGEFVDAANILVYAFDASAAGQLQNDFWRVVISRGLRHVREASA